MRGITTVATVAAASLAFTQTITSVQNGLWDDTATWDCGCVPLIEEVEVLHAVEITGNMIFFNAHVHVAPGGVLFNTTPYSIAITESMTSDGALHFMGDVDIDGILVINGDAQVIGEVHNDHLLLLGDPAAHLHVEGDFVNQDTVDGIGSICATELTANAGSILGQLDLCDATPGTMTPPVLDINTGIVGPGVTFCLGTVCIAPVNGSLDPGVIELFPVPAGDVLHVRGIPPGAEVIVLDRLGRAVHVFRDQWTIDVSGFPAGAYVAVITMDEDRCLEPFTVLRADRP